MQQAETCCIFYLRREKRRLLLNKYTLSVLI